MTDSQENTYYIVFNIVEIVGPIEGRWQVRGRVWANEGIRIGDIVFGGAIQSYGEQLLVPFRVVHILCYEQSVEHIAMTWVGQLTLEGEKGEVLRHANKLFKFHTPQDVQSQ
jgi:hypothetical protein